MVLKAKVVEQERVDIRRPPPHTCVHVFFVYVLPVLDWEFHRRLGSKRLKNDIQAPKSLKWAPPARAVSFAARGPLGSSSHCNLSLPHAA